MIRIMLFLSLMIAIPGCDQRQGHNVPAVTSNNKVITSPQALRKLTDSLSRDKRFNPGNGPENHLAVPITVIDEEIQTKINYSKVQRIRGPMPRMRKAGDFSVTMKFNGKTQDSMFYMPNPLYVRVESGARRGRIRLDSTTFLVPLPMPPDPSPDTIILKNNDDDPVRLPIDQSALRKYLKNP